MSVPEAPVTSTVFCFVAIRVMVIAFGNPWNYVWESRQEEMDLPMKAVVFVQSFSFRNRCFRRRLPRTSMDTTEEGTDAGIEQSLDKITRLQETTVLQSKAELTLLFKNKMSVSLPNIS